MINFFDKKEWRLLWLFYVSKFIETSFVLIAAYLVIYLRNIGFSFFQISILTAVNFAASFIFEIPTGSIADIFGRRVSIIIRTVVKGAVLLIIPFTRDFLTLFALFAIWGIAETFKSGADEAWVTDWLKYNQSEYLLKDYIAKETAIGFIGGTIGPFIAATLLHIIDMKHLWTIQGFSLFISLIFIFLAKEHFTKKKVYLGEYWQKTVDNIKGGLKFSWRHKSVLYLMIAVLFVWFVNAIIDMMWQPYLRNTSLPVEYIGYVLSAASALSAAAALLGGWIAKRLKKNHYFLAVIATTQLLLALFIGITYSPELAVFVLLALFILGPLRFPSERSYFQKFIPASIRATVTSVRSAIGTVGIVTADLVAGLAADNFGPQKTIMLSAIALVPAVILYLKAGDKKIEKSYNN